MEYTVNKPALIDCQETEKKYGKKMHGRQCELWTELSRILLYRLSHSFIQVSVSGEVLHTDFVAVCKWIEIMIFVFVVLKRLISTDYGFKTWCRR